MDLGADSAGQLRAQPQQLQRPARRANSFTFGILVVSFLYINLVLVIRLLNGISKYVSFLV